MGRKRKPDRLSVEASKAFAAGMSYGKWKALQPPDKPAPPPKPKNLKAVKCQWCGKTFYQSDRLKRKYCDDCRFEATHQHKKSCSVKWRAEHREHIAEYQKKWREQNAVSKV